MKKKHLLMALCLCTILGVGSQTFARDKDIPEIVNKTYENLSYNGYGGALFNTITSVITNSNFKNNKVGKGYDGGAIHNTGSLTINDNSLFEGNQTSSKNGGAINNLGTLNVADTSFVGNISSKNGGAIYSSGNLSITGNSIFDGNNATGGQGGAIAINTSKVDLTTIIGDNVKFLNNVSKSHGGAISIDDSTNRKVDIKIGNNVVFENNTSGYHGGAVYSYFRNANSKLEIGDNVVFKNNTINRTGTANGGALYAGGNTTIGDNAQFINNSTKSKTGTGGAIYIAKAGFKIDKGAEFISNSAVQGGAIMQAADDELNLDQAKFIKNSAEGDQSIGGAIALGVKDTKPLAITNSLFEDNSSGVTGGAIGQLDGSKATINIDNVTFKDNVAGSEGGAMNSDAELNIKNSTFVGNKTTGTKIDENNSLNSDGGGGAIFLYDEGKATIENSSFENNSSGTYGGAVSTRIGASNDKSSLKIENSNFVGNNAGVSGGAIASFVDATVTDSSFVNNSAGQTGGAIYANGNLTINATNSDVVMSGNTAADGGDIYMNTAGKNLNMNIAENRTMTVADGISGQNYNMIVNADSANTGSLVVNSYIKNATMNVQNGTLHLAQGSSLVNSTLNMASGTTLNTIDGNTTDFGSNVTLADNVNLAVDLNLGNGKADNFSGANVQGNVTITDINKIGTTTANNINVNLADLLGIDPSNVTISQGLQNQTQTILTPIRYLSGSVSETGMLTMAPTGNSYKDFNPAIMASPVAAQLGGYLTQLNSYDEAFRNMDLYMLMTREQRQAMKLRNRYVASDGNLVFDPTSNHYENKAMWFRPYATFENVPLKGGPRVSNVAYGSFFGGDSEMYDLGHGWDGMLSVYAGYNGSHQAYDGIGIYQNGGTFGVTGMAYKGNFFTGLTVNAGANAGEANTAYGTDNFAMLMAGVASKTGYNWELAKGKFIIQPSYMMSYSFVNTFDYTNAAGVRVDSNPLNAIQIEPGIKFIGNLKNGWQPYLGVSMVWNIMDKTNFNANNVSLPELSVKPYVRYGLGVRKTWGDRLSGFIQAFFTSGGRNGVGLQAGFRINIGKAGTGVKGSNKTPELPKTQIKLSSMES